MPTFDSIEDYTQQGYSHEAYYPPSGTSGYEGSHSPAPTEPIDQMSETDRGLAERDEARRARRAARDDHDARRFDDFNFRSDVYALIDRNPVIKDLIDRVAKLEADA